MLLCDDQHVPEVYVSAVEKVSAERGHVGVPTVQPIYQTFSQQLAAQFPSGGGSNNVWGSIPTTNPSFDQTMNPIIVEDQTIDEVVEEPYNEDDRSIPEYNPHSEYGLDDFNEDYNGDGGSREGVNDEAAHHHGMDSNPTNGGGCTWFCKKKFVDFCSDFYKTNTWLESYSGLIFPVGHPTEWNTPAEVRSEVVLPPEWRAQAGRPRKNRIPSAGEHGSKTRHCPICKKSGYNRQNCPNPPADQQVNVLDPPIVPPPPPQRRKCKSCKQEGHNIRTCPTRPYDNLTDADNDVE
ncbi:hypothetical protein LWI29_004849 [Acer saccharum]|uniref:CCHC-type domain-containing protein n=1 Tax=Acer saccharum TaxID=4024 RepID=A0AA39SXB4_ACESA|nr:hypothetical protein LWI29_004849 [Acer saccharum]